MATVVSKIGKIVRFPDLRVENHGSIFLLRSRTEVGETFIEDHAPEDAQYFGPTRSWSNPATSKTGWIVPAMQA